MDSEAGASVLLSTNAGGESQAVDSTTFTIPAAEADGGSLGVENIIGTLTEDECARIESCAAG